MYNVNVNVNANPGSGAGLLSVAAEVTPRTPEIVNSLIAMTNPFDGYNAANHQPGAGFPGNHRSFRDRADSSSSGEPSPPSIQHTCSQLIKEGLKLTLQTKRRANGAVDENKKRTRKEYISADDEEDDESSNSKSITGLTPEDEERRRRRRERNKIAATKCRLKKREKTVILVQESETLESQNHELKSQIQELETQRRRLVDMLNLHGPTCIKQPPTHSNDTSYNHQQPQQQPQQQQQYGEPVAPLPSYQENFVNQTAQSDCAIVSDFGPVKVEGFEAVAQDFFRQAAATPYGSVQPVATTTMTTTTTTITGSTDATGCAV